MTPRIVPGLRGPAGPPGPQGAPGSVGPQGPAGTGIAVKTPVANAAALPASGNSTNDGRITLNDGHLHVWSGSAWVDSGQIKGDPGAQGPAGQGVPTGGSTGQVLAKTSSTNYATTWVNPPTGGGSGATDMDGITDATATGKAIVRATDAAAARSAIGAGTSSVAIGTNAGQAADAAAVTTALAGKAADAELAAADVANRASSTRGLVSGRRMASGFDSNAAAWGLKPTIYYSSTTGWPTRASHPAVAAGYTGRVEWNSLVSATGTVISVDAPPPDDAGQGDTWTRRKPGA